MGCRPAPAATTRTEPRSRHRPPTSSLDALQELEPQLQTRRVSALGCSAIAPAQRDRLGNSRPAPPGRRRRREPSTTPPLSPASQLAARSPATTDTRTHVRIMRTRARYVKSVEDTRLAENASTTKPQTLVGYIEDTQTPAGDKCRYGAANPHNEAFSSACSVRVRVWAGNRRGTAVRARSTRLQGRRHLVRGRFPHRCR